MKLSRFFNVKLSYPCVLWSKAPNQTLPHHSQNRPLQLVAEIAPSLDNLSQHLTVFARKVSQFLSQRLRAQRRNPFLRLGLNITRFRVRVPSIPPFANLVKLRQLASRAHSERGSCFFNLLTRFADPRPQMTGFAGKVSQYLMKCNY